MTFANRLDPHLRRVQQCERPNERLSVWSLHCWTIASDHSKIEFENIACIVCLFCCFMSQVNSYGHGGTVSSPNHTFSWVGLNKRLTSNSCAYFRLLLTTTLLEWISGREENDRRNHFMINLHESMGPDRDRTRDPWICSQPCICSQTRYRLRYAVRLLGA